MCVVYFYDASEPENFIMVALKITVLWDVMPHRLVGRDGEFGETICLDHLNEGWRQQVVPKRLSTRLCDMTCQNTET